MLDRLPLSLQQLILLEWLSPKAVCVVARAGSTRLRSAVMSSPRAFRAAKGEILNDACVRWFRLLRRPGTPQPPPLVLWSEKITRADGPAGLRHIWYLNGKLHRDDDLPAEVRENGAQFWYQNCELHRDDDKPAVIRADGQQEWYQRGKRHRDGDKPTVVRADGTREWRTWFGIHRQGGRPAVVYPDGREEWYEHGLRWSPSDRERLARGLANYVFST